MGKGPEIFLKPEDFKRYIDNFNQNNPDRTADYIENGQAWEWFEQNIPFFESSDKGLEEIYYYRWWLFGKHIKKTPEGFVITGQPHEQKNEGRQNTSSRAAAMHFYEGRWLRDRKYLKDYASFWFNKGGSPRQYSFGAADAICAWSKVTHDEHLAYDLLSDLVKNFKEWERTNREPASEEGHEGLFFQEDIKDGMGLSAGGSGYRPTINSCMYGEARAIAEIAEYFWIDDIAKEFRAKAEKLKKLIEWNLWDDVQSFFKTLPRGTEEGIPLWRMYQNRPWLDARELSGYAPWLYNLPEQGFERAWKYLMDPEGFLSAYGPATLEKRSARYLPEGTGELGCNGPSWPYATSQVLTAMANLLNNYKQNYVDKKDYMELLRKYAFSQHRKNADGNIIPFVSERLNPETGEWLDGGNENGDCQGVCNHSTFIDLVITGLVGLRPRRDHVVELNPLVPEDSMDYFCLDGVRYHDCDLTIIWDRTGTRYNKGKGLHVFTNGREIGKVPGLHWMEADLPDTYAGWKKHGENPVIGSGKPVPGTASVFDVEVLLEDGKFRLYGSWRLENCIAIFEGIDGVNWSKPEVVLAPNPDTAWEKDLSRPTIVKKEDCYHMWYTAWPSDINTQGQPGWYSCIGYATSKDGKKWKRMSDKPVLSADRPWEGVVIMCPNVLWDDKEKVFKMWYSAGFKGIEPNVIGYATSPDGLNWTKYGTEPIFVSNEEYIWEQEKVAGCHVFHWGEWYYMAYIGWRDTYHAQIGLARSKDGITNWERHPGNPIIRPGQKAWDKDACYKPLMRFDGKQWLLWYNGRDNHLERMGLAVHEGEDLGFE